MPDFSMDLYEALDDLTQQLDWATSQLNIEEALCCNTVSAARDRAHEVLAKARGETIAKGFDDIRDDLRRLA